jgi:hypothetical protein
VLLAFSELPRLLVEPSWGLLHSLLSYLLLYLMSAYIIAGAPALLYAAFMEWRFARGLEPASWRAVGLAALSGLVAGVGMIGSMQLFFGADGGRTEAWIYATFGTMGLLVGAIVGTIIRWLERRAPRRVA